MLSRPDRLGDVIISSALLPRLKSLWPDAEVILLIDERMHGLFWSHPLLAGLLSTESSIQELRECGAEAIVNLEPNRVLQRRAKEAGIPIRIGYGDWWERAGLRPSDLTQVVKDQRPLGREHESLSAWRLLEGLGLSSESGEMTRASLSLEPSAKGSLQAKLPWSLQDTAYLVVNPTAHSRTHRWKWKSFFEVAQRLMTQESFELVLTAGEAQDPDLMALAEACKSRGLACINLGGKLTVTELGWLLQHARLHLSRNTGSSHLAAALDCRQVEIFIRHTGRYSVDRWRALSPRTLVIRPPVHPRLIENAGSYAQRCAESISVETVLEAAQQALRLP